MMASSGSCGVESSLNISISPLRTITKSVNVPPVSTPTLKIDLGDILNEFREDGSDILDCSFMIAIPCDGVDGVANLSDAINGNVSQPSEICIRRRSSTVMME